MIRGIALMLSLLVAGEASAACCWLVKVDAETPPVSVRACEPAADGGCGAVLLEVTLDLGESAEACTVADVVVYQEYDAASQAYGPPTTAVCDGGEVEL